MKITIIKLASGEEIIGQTDADMMLVHGIVYKIKNPMLILKMGSEDGPGIMIKLHNLLLLSDNDTIDLRTSHIMATFEPGESLIKYYETALDYTTKIMKPTLNAHITTSADNLEEYTNQMQKRQNDGVTELLNNIFNTKGDETLQ